jgi:uncharacterized protein YgiM (DUF1202 family)
MQKVHRVRTLLFVLSMLLLSSVACDLSQEAAPTQTREPAEPPTAVAPATMPALPDPVWGATTTWFVVGSTADIHACASADCAIIETVSFGKRLVVLETVDNWHRVRLAAGEHGWIEADLTSQSAVCASCE